MSRALSWTACVVTTLSACEHPPTEQWPKLGGSVGRGEFRYLPLSDGDVETSPRPTADVVVAQGARFGAEFTPHVSGEQFLLGPASAAFFRPQGAGFSAERVGFGGLLAEGVSGIDYTHLEVREIARLTIETTPVALVSLRPGDTLILRSLPSDRDGRTLVGSLPVQWSVSDLSRVTLEPTMSAPGARQTLTARSPGSVTVEASLGARTAELQLEVLAP